MSTSKEKAAKGRSSQRKTPGGNQSLEKGLIMLNLLNENSRPMGIREIARRLELSTTVAHRLATTLLEYDFLRQATDTRKYLLGYKSITLGMDMMRKDELISVALAELKAVSETSSLNTFLGVLSGKDLLYVLSFQANSVVSIRNTPGMTANLHSTSMGKALIANMDDKTVKDLLGTNPLEKMTPDTITNVDDLLAHLKLVRAQGYATSLAENLPGIYAASTTVRDSDGRVLAAVGTAFAPQLSPDQKIEDAIDKAIEAAVKISQRLGCPPNYLPSNVAVYGSGNLTV